MTNIQTSEKREFEFSVFTKRWGHKDTYTFIINREGWFLKDAQGDFTGQCDKSGDPYLYKNLDHDDVFYFKGGLKAVLKSIWKKKLKGVSDTEIQEMLTKIADLASESEKNKLDKTRPNNFGKYLELISEIDCIKR